MFETGGRGRKEVRIGNLTCTCTCLNNNQ